MASYLFDSAESLLFLMRHLDITQPLLLRLASLTFFFLFVSFHCQATGTLRACHLGQILQLALFLQLLLSYSFGAFLQNRQNVAFDVLSQLFLICIS